MIKMTPRRWAVLFFCSLALNLFLAGVLAAGAYKWDRGRHFRGSMMTVPWALRVLGDDARPAARKQFRAHRADIRARRTALRETYREAGRILAQEPYDGAALARTLAKLGETARSARTRSHASMAEFAASLTQGQRHELARAVERRAARWEKRAAKYRARREKRNREK